jgi:hypothetical protein
MKAHTNILVAGILGTMASVGPPVASLTATSLIPNQQVCVNGGNDSFKNPGVALTDLPVDQRNAILAIVAQMNLAKKTAIETAIHPQTGTVCLVGTINPIAVSDGGTIALNVNLPNWYNAIQLLHEWEHVLISSAGGPDGNDPNNDGPCGSCAEGSMGADDLQTMAEYICGEGIKEEDVKEGCATWSKDYVRVNGLLNDCYENDCPNPPAVDIMPPSCCPNTL